MEYDQHLQCERVPRLPDSRLAQLCYTAVRDDDEMEHVLCRYAALEDGELPLTVDVCAVQQRVERVYTSSTSQLTVYVISSNETTRRNFLLQYQRMT